MRLVQFHRSDSQGIHSEYILIDEHSAMIKMVNAHQYQTQLLSVSPLRTACDY
jgi:hypothetical protein